MKTKVELRYIDHSSNNIVLVDYAFKDKLYEVRENISCIINSKSTKFKDYIKEVLPKNINKMFEDYKKGDCVVYLYYVDYPAYKAEYNNKINQFFKVLKH